MSSEKKNVAYKHKLKQRSDGSLICLIGIHPDMTEDDIDLIGYADLETESYPRDYLFSYFGLSPENRKVIDDLVVKLKEEEKAKVHIPYWKMVIDYIHDHFNKTIEDIAADMVRTDYDRVADEIKGSDRVYEREDIADRVKKSIVDRGTKNPRITNDMKNICRYYFLTEDILYTGAGKTYMLWDDDYSESNNWQKHAEMYHRKYTVNRINEVVEKFKQQGKSENDISLKDIILATVVDIDEKNLAEIPVRVVSRKYELNDEHIKQVMDVMKELSVK